MGKTVLVTGATGYVGGRLIPLLLEAGYTVRAGVRSLEKIRSRPWALHPSLEPVIVDLFKPDTITRALMGCDAAYYLVHSMRPDIKDFADQDREAAYNFVEAANIAELPRIIYLGGLGDVKSELSHHLRSRAEVARILRLARAEVTCLRAAMILGSGSASFEILRYLVDRLPVMLAPRWVETRVQPVSIRNVVQYLLGCLENPETASTTFDIGGPDVLTYRELFLIYAQEAGLKARWTIPVPILSPRLSAYWVSLITPVPVALVRPLVEGLKNEVICRDNRIRELVPQELVSCREAIHNALEKTRTETVDTCCYDMGDACTPEWAMTEDARFSGGLVYSCGYTAMLEGSMGRIWEPVERIGGSKGWYSGDWLWQLRGFFDKLLSGPGRRGRRDQNRLGVGDALDFWRVVDVRTERRLLLKAEMRLPGEALLEFRLLSHSGNQTELRMIARFRPRGLGGIAYWWGMYPFHLVLFKNMIVNIAQAANTKVLSGPERFRLER